MADYKFITYHTNGGKTDSDFTYRTYKEVLEMVTDTILPMKIVTKVEITRNGEKLEELTKDEKMTEKIIISKNLNKWLEEHPTLNTDDTMYSERFGGEVFQELIHVWIKAEDTKIYSKVLEAFALRGNTKIAHLWLLLNRDKWEVEKDKLFYICIPEPDGVNAWLSKKEDEGIDFHSLVPSSERFKWTQEEIDKHEVAKHLQHFKKEVEN